MKDDKTAPQEIEPRWFSVVIWVAFPSIMIPPQVFEFPIVATSTQEAAELVNQMFMQHFYNPIKQTWKMGDTVVDPWFIAAIPYPDYISDRMTAELPDDVEDVGVSPEEMVRARIIQLFPSPSPDSGAEPPP